MKRTLALCILLAAAFTANAQNELYHPALKATPAASPSTSNEAAARNADFYTSAEAWPDEPLPDDGNDSVGTLVPTPCAHNFVTAPDALRLAQPAYGAGEPYLRMGADSVDSIGNNDEASADGAAAANGAKDANGDTSFRWKPAIKQSLLFLAVQHGYAFTQPKTRRDLKGPFLRDYFRSVRSLNKWGDGGRFFTNYIAHPMQGSLTGYIQIHNDPKGIRHRFGSSGAYWRSRMKAMAWSAAWSTQFEIGPVSQASIGNVGLHDKQTYVDIVITPTAGLGLLLAEDAMDKFVIERIERRTNNFYMKIGSRMVLNPTRTIANLFRFKKPWYRDAGLR